MRGWTLVLSAVLLLPSAAGAIPESAGGVVVAVAVAYSPIDLQLPYENSRDLIEQIGPQHYAFTAIKMTLPLDPQGMSFSAVPSNWMGAIERYALGEANLSLAKLDVNLPIVRFGWVGFTPGEELYFEQIAEYGSETAETVLNGEWMKAYSGPGNIMHIECSSRAVCLSDMAIVMGRALEPLAERVAAMRGSSVKVQQDLREFSLGVPLRLTTEAAEERYAALQSIASLDELRMWANLNFAPTGFLRPSLDRELFDPLFSSFESERERAINVVKDAQNEQLDLLSQAQRALELQARYDESARFQIALQASFASLVVSLVALVVAMLQLRAGHNRALESSQATQSRRKMASPGDVAPTTENAPEAPSSLSAEGIERL